MDFKKSLLLTKSSLQLFCLGYNHDTKYCYEVVAVSFVFQFWNF